MHVLTVQRFVIVVDLVRLFVVYSVFDLFLFDETLR